MFIFKPQNGLHVVARLQIAYVLLVAILAFLGCGDKSKTGHMTDAASSGKIVVGYYPSWKQQYLSGVDLSKYTHINMAYAIVQADGSFSFDGDWFLQGLVVDAHSKGAKVLISLGGWTGSFAFSPLVASPTARANLISNIVTYINNNKLDGVDIDWYEFLISW
jgi:GH18 family chitinase